MKAESPQATQFLGNMVSGQVYDSLPVAADSPRVIEKPARDRIVINDPGSAPLIRAALAPEDLAAWRHLPPSRFLIAIPRGWTKATLGIQPGEEAAFNAFAARHPTLTKALAPHAEALRQQAHGDFWWELPPYPVDFFTTQSIIWPATGALCVAPSLSGAFLLAGIAFTTAPTSFLLGVMGSRPLREAARLRPTMAAADAVWLPMPYAGEIEQEQIGALAEQLVQHAAARMQLDREVTTRIMRDFAPAGAAQGPVLAEWWRLSFDDFRAELERRFKGDVPYRFREPWQVWLNSQRVNRQIHDATIARLEVELDERVRQLSP